MNYTWIPFFSELFDNVLTHLNERSLAVLALRIFDGSGGLVDEDAPGSKTPIQELDPFSFIALFNRGGEDKTSLNKRITWCERAKAELSLKSDVPRDFSGIPVFDYRATLFHPFTRERGGWEIPVLWKMASEIRSGHLTSQTFRKSLSVKCCGVAKLTQAFYIVRPESYLPLDQNTKTLLNSKGVESPAIKAKKDKLELEDYLELVTKVKEFFNGKKFYEISLMAWQDKTVLGDDRKTNDTEDSVQRSYWWLNCNPAIWDPRPLAIGSKQTYTTHNEAGNKRRVYQYFLKVKPGDQIVGYITSPTQVVATLHEVTRSIFIDENDQEVFEFKKIKDLNPISLDQIREFEGFKNSEPLKNNQGSLFALTKQEFDLIQAAAPVLINNSESSSASQSWMIAAGQDAQMWPEWKEKGIVSIGWDEVGNLVSLSSSSDIKQKYVDIYQPGNEPIMDVKALYEFAHKINVGDLVFAKQGRSRWFGYGRVISDYIYDDSRPSHKNIRRIEWLKTGEWRMPDEDKVSIKTLTNLSQYPDFLARLMGVINGSSSVVDNSAPYSVDDAMNELFTSKEDFVSMLDGLTYKKNIVLQGPPGVGKTFAAKRLAYSLIGSSDESRIGFVQFHPSYSYEDFVQGIRPVNGGGFEIQDGLFVQFCEKARISKKPFVVIIDEINRGNLAKIFGELLLLIESDKRTEKIRLTYSKNEETFSVPDNLFIIGTMNTADRSLSLMDYALRRRFLFFTLKSEIMSKNFEKHLSEIGVNPSGIKRIQDRIGELNSLIRSDSRNLGTGFEIGHSYFSQKPSQTSFDQWFENIMKLEIEPLLREYWYDDADKVTDICKRLKAA